MTVCGAVCTPCDERPQNDDSDTPHKPAARQRSRAEATPVRKWHSQECHPAHCWRQRSQTHPPTANPPTAHPPTAHPRAGPVPPALKAHLRCAAHCSTGLACQHAAERNFLLPLGMAPPLGAAGGGAAQRTGRKQPPMRRAACQEKQLRETRQTLNRQHCATMEWRTVMTP